MVLFEFFTHPKLIAYAGLMIPLAIQAALLHPYYQKFRVATLIRRGLIPIIALMAFATAPVRKWQPLSESMMPNFCFVALVTFHATCLGFEHGLYDGPIFKQARKAKKGTMSSGEDTPEVPQGKTEDLPSEQNGIKRRGVNSEEREDQNSSSLQNKTESKVIENKEDETRKPSMGQLVRFVVWLLFSPRGLECYWAPHPSILKHREPISKAAFFGETLLRALQMHIWGTSCWALAAYGFSHPQGFQGIIRDYTGWPYSAVLEYLASHGLSFCLGAAMWSGIEIATCGMNTLELLFYPLARWLLPQDWAPEEPFDPRRYPSLFSTPWQRTSVTDFWGRGWHSLFRRDLIFCGALPVVKLAASLGCSGQVQKAVGMMGAMFLSALMHEYAIASVASVDKHGLAIVSFFMKCAAIMLIENLIETHTRFKFQGFWGRLWTFGWLMHFGKPGLELWRERGLGQGLLPITEWRWSQILFPAGYTLPPNWFAVLPF